MPIAISRREDNPTDFENGFAKAAWLHDEHAYVKGYKCLLKAGHSVRPELYPDKKVVLLFGFGTGYVADERKAYNVDGVAVYIANFDKTPYAVHAVTDMEFMMVLVDMVESDWRAYEDSHTVLPYFKKPEDSDEYVQACKGPNVRSWILIPNDKHSRILAGIVVAHGGEGTVEKGHPAVDQWNFTLPGADFTLTVEDESVEHTEAEWSYVLAGLDHSLVSEPGKTLNYVWFEHKTAELGY